MHPRRNIIFCLILSLALLWLPSVSLGASFSSVSDSLSSSMAEDTSVTHTLNFTTTTSSPVKVIKVQFSTTENGSTKPASLSLSSATLTSTANLGSGWSLDTGNAAAGYIYISRATADTIDTGIEGEIIIAGITNSAISDCQPNELKLEDTCHVKITSYSDVINGTEVDSGITTYTVTEDPYLNFEIKSVASGQTHNGITTTIGSTSTTLPFNRIFGGGVNYSAHELSVSTNAPSGYIVYSYVENNLRGVTPANTIQPFGAVNATWDNPLPWSQPDGSTANDNTGWFGANTTDYRVSTAWLDGQYLFGPISSIPHAVARSPLEDRAGSSIFVTYALGINALQPSDSYTTNLVYNVYTTY